MMLEKHVQINRSELILHPDKIEWLVFSRAFVSGKMRRLLGDILAVAISKLKDYDQGQSQSPAALLHNYANAKQKDNKDILLAIRKIREKGDELVVILCEHEGGQFVIELLNQMGPYIEILFESLGKSSHKDPKIFGRAVLSVCMEVALADMPYQFEHTLRKKAIYRKQKAGSKRGSAAASRRGSTINRLSIMDGPTYSGHATPKAGGRRGSQAVGSSGINDDEQAEIEEKVEEARYESNKLVLLNLLNPRDLKEYLIVRYGVDKNALELMIDGKQNKSDQAVANDDFEATLAKMKIFAIETQKIIASRKVEDPNLGSYDTRKVEFERELYNDFVTIRSKCFRRITQVTRSSLATLGKYAGELFNPVDDDTFWHKVREMEELKYQEDDSRRMNVRHDPYNTDRFKKVVKCTECALMHPLNAQLDAGGKRGAGVAGKKGPAKANSQMVLDEEFRMSTEDCLSLWSVLNEPQIRSIIESKAGAIVWKEVESQLDKETAFFRQGGARSTEHSNRYLQAKMHFVQFKEACDPRQSEKKRVLVYFGSDTQHSVEGSSMEPINVFQHLTHMSTTLQVESQANDSKVLAVQTVLQHMAEENKTLVDDDDRMTQEYRQLHSDTPNKTAISDTMYKQLTAFEKDIFQREVIEENIGELNVFIDTKGQIYIHSYEQLISDGVLIKADTDPSNFSMWTLSCLTWPCCVAYQTKDDTKLAKFLRNLNFVFVTGTEEHYLVDFHLRHANNSKLYSTTIDLRNLAKDGASFQFVYEPRGDMVEIQDRVDFNFDRENLLQFLRKMSRPRLHKRGAGLGEVTGLDLLGWDATKFT